MCEEDNPVGQHSSNGLQRLPGDGNWEKDYRNFAFQREGKEEGKGERERLRERESDLERAHVCMLLSSPRQHERLGINVSAIWLPLSVDTIFFVRPALPLNP